MLDSSQILQFLQEHEQELADRFSVVQIGVFGSVRTAKSRENSDVDILVEMREPTFDHYMDLKFYLENHLGRPVDLVLADTIKPRLRTRITREVVYA